MEDKEAYITILLIGLGLFTISGLLLGFNFNSPTTLGAIGRVFGGLLLFPSGVLTFDGIAKGRTLYILSKKNGEGHIAFWHKDKPNER